jgi:hypothetical protein
MRIISLVHRSNLNCAVPERIFEMSDILESLFYGDITPADRVFTDNADYKLAMEDLVELEAKLKEVLDDYGRSLLDSLIEAEAKIQSIVSRECFADGLKKGIRIVVSAIANGSNL